MKKKIISFLLIAAMTFGLTACGSGNGNEGAAGTSDTADASGTTDTGAASAADDGSTYNIKMQIATFGQEFPGLADVEAAIAAITEPEIGVTVTLEPVAAWDLPTTSSLAITSNEVIDLICILPMGSSMDSVSNYSSKICFCR